MNLYRFTLKAASARYGGGHYRKGQGVTCAKGTPAYSDLDQDPRWSSPEPVAPSGAVIAQQSVDQRAWTIVRDLAGSVEGWLDRFKAQPPAVRDRIAELYKQPAVRDRLFEAMEQIGEALDLQALDDLDPSEDLPQPAPPADASSVGRATPEPVAEPEPVEPVAEPEPAKELSSDEAELAHIAREELAEALTGRTSKGDLIELAKRAGMPCDDVWVLAPSQGGLSVADLKTKLRSLMESTDGSP